MFIRKLILFIVTILTVQTVSYHAVINILPTYGVSQTNITSFFNALSPASSDILFLGDSVVHSISENDVDNKSIGQLLSHALSPKSVVTLADAGYDPVLFEAALNYAARRNGMRPSSWRVFPAS